MIAAALVLTVAIYLAVRWSRAPTAFRAIGAVANVRFAVGSPAGGLPLPPDGRAGKTCRKELPVPEGFVDTPPIWI
jgi:hypothetical protein